MTAIQITFTLLLVASVVMFFRSDEGDENRKLASYLFVAGAAMAFGAMIMENGSLSEKCDAGDDYACWRLER